MGKKAKEHRRKVEKRNRLIQQERKRFEKQTLQMIDKLKNEQSFTETPKSGIEFPNPIEPISNSILMNGPQI